MISKLNACTAAIQKVGSGKKILLATVPFDGHVNPLTGLAVYLKNSGYDVRWYTSQVYAAKINRLGIKHYPFVKAMDMRSDDNPDNLFPDRKFYKSRVAKLNFDFIHLFIDRATEYFGDIQDIYKSFPFDVMIADFAFTAIPFVKQKMNVPVINANVVPLTENSKDLPPAGLGMTPVRDGAGGNY